MSFNPLGKFDPHAALNEAAKAAAISLLAKLPDCPHGSLDRIYNHWTVGHYNTDFPEYNIGVANDNGRFHLDISGDPRDNAIGVNNHDPHSHTYRRNTGALGVSTDDMVGAGTHDFGPEPVTLTTIEFLCAANAALAKKYSIDVNGRTTRAPYAGEHTILTHAEAGDLVGSPPQYPPYGPKSTFERWDLLSFVPIPEGVSFTDATVTGDAIRARSRAYKLALG